MTSIHPHVPVITVDGPSGVGKGAVCAALAQALGWHILDSGVVYRALALAAKDAEIAPDDEKALLEICDAMALEFIPIADGVSVWVNGAPADQDLRTEEVSQMASKVAAIPSVRAALLARQHGFRRPPGLIADGRDMGTVVFPDAEAKIFLTASPEERAHRRYKQLKEKGQDVIFSRLVKDITERDQRDRDRKVAPTVPAPDAKVIDSTGMPLAQVVEEVMTFVRTRCRLPLV